MKVSVLDVLGFRFLGLGFRVCGLRCSTLWCTDLILKLIALSKMTPGCAFAYVCVCVCVCIRGVCDVCGVYVCAGEGWIAHVIVGFPKVSCAQTSNASLSASQ